MMNNNISNKQILFLGLGYELTLILDYLIKDFNLSTSNLAFTRRNKEEGYKQEIRYNIKFYSNNLEAIKIRKPEIIFIGVKPQDIPDIFPELLETKNIWQHLIFISASTPFETIVELFPNKIISNIIPEVHFNQQNPSGFSQYCSTLDTDPIIEALFKPTLSSLLKVFPDQMTTCTVLLCQATPLLYLGLQLFHKQDNVKNIHEYLKSFISGIINPKNFTTPESKLLNDGYTEALSKTTLPQEQSFQILNIVLKSLITEKIQELPKDNPGIESQINNWATEGGYDAMGVKIVKELLSQEKDLINFPDRIIQAQIINGETLKTDIKEKIKSI